MKNLIIPCAGRSSRFPGMKPKWLLTHPHGKLMVFAGLRDFPTEQFNRVILTIHKSHISEYEAVTVLEQATHVPIEICILDDWTSGPAETVSLTIEKMNVVGEIVIKDSDNATSISSNALLKSSANFAVGVNIQKNTIRKPESKSFLVVNSQNLITDIVEKEIVSGEICAGVYGFSSADMFQRNYSACVSLMKSREIFVSHVISHSINAAEVAFEFIEATSFEDWGTAEEWFELQRANSTIFVDFDGVLALNSGKYGSFNWSSPIEPLRENLELLANLHSMGAQIVITTARDSSHESSIVNLLKEFKIVAHAMVFSLNHAPRTLINDFAPTNPYPSSRAINLPRNSNLSDYIKS